MCSNFPNIDARVSFLKFLYQCIDRTTSRTSGGYMADCKRIIIRRCWVIVLRSHLFSLRRALKLRSASADAAGELDCRSKRTSSSMNFAVYSPRSSGDIPFRISTGSFTHLIERFLRKKLMQIWPVDTLAYRQINRYRPTFPHLSVNNIF
jgi:hypothetical protein